MNTRPSHRIVIKGSTLVEVVVSMGVLAVAVPLVFGALAETGDSGMASRAETRSAWMIPVCLDEIRASREGRPRYFTSTVSGQTFPPEGELWALAFSPGGQPVGRLTRAIYQQGVRELDGAEVGYVASVNSAMIVTDAGADRMLRVDISLEYPAVRSAEDRHKLEFHTYIP